MSQLDTLQERALQQLVDALGDTPWVLIGATALACQTDMDWRRTNDLDIALAVELAAVPEALERLDGWQRDARREHRWRTRDGMIVDVIPAADSLLEAGSLTWASGAVMNLTGLELALAHHEEVKLASGAVVCVATIPVVAILKMVAYLDRPAERERDLHDLSALLSRYLDDDDERRFEAPLLQLHHDEQSAFALGANIARVAQPAHRQCVNTFVGRLVPESVDLARATALAGFRFDDAAEEKLLRNLRCFRDGLRAGTPSAAASKKRRHGFAGYVTTADGTLFNPLRISQIGKGSEAPQAGPQSILEPIEFTYDYVEEGMTLNHVVWVPRDRGWTFQDEIDAALDERRQPDWTDPLGGSR